MTDELNRKVLTFDDDTGDGVQFVAHDKVLHVHCHSDWCGNTESGIGAEVGYDLNLSQAAELHAFLGAFLSMQKETP